MKNDIVQMAQWLRRMKIPITETRFTEGYVIHLLDFRIGTCEGTLYKDKYDVCKVLNLVDIIVSNIDGEANYDDICLYLKYNNLTAEF